VVDAFRQVAIDQLVGTESGPILLPVPRRISPSGNIALELLGFDLRQVAQILHGYGDAGPDQRYHLRQHRFGVGHNMQH